MTEIMNVNRAAPLKNVAAFTTLLGRMVDRDADLPGLACFFGPSGYGKTKSAIYGANRHRAAYLECGQFTTARSLLANILKELGETNPKGTIEALLTRAIEFMSANPRRPVIVDEAHFVAGKRFVDLLRELSDKSGAAVILIGEELLPRHLENFERVHNRVLEWLPAVPCDAEDFALLAASRLKKLRLAPDLAAEILKRTEGNTRRIVINLAKAESIAQLNNWSEIDLTGFGGSTAIVAKTTMTPRPYR